MLAAQDGKLEEHICVSSISYGHPRTFAKRLLSRRLSQNLIDPILPARSGLLEIIKNIPIDAQ